MSIHIHPKHKFSDKALEAIQKLIGKKGERK